MNEVPIKADNIGDTLPASDFNAYMSELENVVKDADITLDATTTVGGDLNMLGKATAVYSASGQTYNDSGAADAYILANLTNLQIVPTYQDGIIATFKPDNTNTGASTVNINSLGVKNITDAAGVALTAGAITSGEYVTIVYNLANDRFEIIRAKETFVYTFTALGPGIITDTSFDGIRIVDKACTIQKVIMSIIESGTAGTTTVDVNVGSTGGAPTTIFTTQGNRPSIGFSGNDWSKVERTNMDITAITAGQILTVDLDVIGTDIQDVTIQVFCK